MARSQAGSQASGRLVQREGSAIVLNVSSMDPYRVIKGSSKVHKGPQTSFKGAQGSLLSPQRVLKGCLNGPPSEFNKEESAIPLDSLAFKMVTNGCRLKVSVSLLK